MRGFTRSQIEQMVAKAFSKKLTSQAFTFTEKDCQAWIFGGCAADQNALDAITNIAKAKGYDSEQWDRVAFVGFMEPLIGQKLAKMAGGVIESQLAE